MRNFLLLLGLLSAVTLAGPELVGKPGAHTRGISDLRMTNDELRPDFRSIANRQSPIASSMADSVHSFDVRHYRLDINLPMTDRSYSAHEFLSFTSRMPSLDVCSLDFRGMVCDSVKQAGTMQAFDTTAGRLIVDLDPPLPQGESAVLDIFFRRTTASPNLGYFFAGQPTVTYAYCMTCTPPEDARYWLACYDAPRDKADRGVALNLTVPDTFQTCANGLCDSVTTGPGTKTYWWRHPHPIATYLIVFSASRFAEWSQTFVGQNGDTTPLLYFMWPQDSAVSTTTFAGLPDMMAYYADSARFGPYPFDKYGMVPGYYAFPWGGMENQTMTMIHTQWLRQGDNPGMAHELSHMWYGDMVTCVDFRNVWLNEGFGTYAECIYVGHAGGRTTFQSYMRSRAGNVFAQDRSRRFPIYDPLPEDIYNYGTIYCKGAWVLHMLRYVEGDTAWENPGVFYRALRAYGDSFRFGTASTDDYRRINEQVTGLDLDWFFDEWVYQAGYPKYYLSWDRETMGDSWRIITYLLQDNGSQAPPVFHMPLPLRLNCATESSLVTLRPESSPDADTFYVASEPRSLTLDPDNWVLDSAFVTGIAEMTNDKLRMTNSLPAIVRGVLRLPEAVGGQRSAVGVLLDASGRRVADLHPGANDVSALAPGVYFVRPGTGAATRVVLVE